MSLQSRLIPNRYQGFFSSEYKADYSPLCDRANQYTVLNINYLYLIKYTFNNNMFEIKVLCFNVIYSLQPVYIFNDASFQGILRNCIRI
jgi:hypothetical protein